MLESKDQPIATRRHFARRVVRSMILAGILILGALAVGMIGYRTLFGVGWIDAMYNAAMILTGMGPVDRPPSDAAKIFASVYALFSGLVFVGTIAIVLAPILHRVLHVFHADVDEDAG